jgi:hypothetical protein
MGMNLLQFNIGAISLNLNAPGLNFTQKGGLGVPHFKIEKKKHYRSKLTLDWCYGITILNCCFVALLRNKRFDFLNKGADSHIFAGMEEPSLQWLQCID